MFILAATYAYLLFKQNVRLDFLVFGMLLLVERTIWSISRR